MEPTARVHPVSEAPVAAPSLDVVWNRQTQLMRDLGPLLATPREALARFEVRRQGLSDPEKAHAVRAFAGAEKKPGGLHRATRKAWEHGKTLVQDWNTGLAELPKYREELRLEDHGGKGGASLETVLGRLRALEGKLTLAELWPGPGAAVREFLENEARLQGEGQKLIDTPRDYSQYSDEMLARGVWKNYSSALQLLREVRPTPPDPKAITAPKPVNVPSLERLLAQASAGASASELALPGPQAPRAFELTTAGPGEALIANLSKPLETLSFAQGAYALGRLAEAQAGYNALEARGGMSPRILLALQHFPRSHLSVRGNGKYLDELLTNLNDVCRKAGFFQVTSESANGALGQRIFPDAFSDGP